MKARGPGDTENAMRMIERETRMLGEVPRLPVHGNNDLRTHPFVHLHQFGTAGMSRDVHVRLLLGDDLHAEIGELVHDPADRDFVPRDDPR